MAPDEYPDWQLFDTYFSERLAVVELPCSGLEHQKTADISAEEAGEAMPDAEGPLVGMRSDVDGRHSPGQ
ncbi:hypothetical protein [Pseudomonas syringae]|uniref:hypothetical protein n=1 Tax=Pseudomonas syringae TaxID=317 RepID=UPI001E5D3D5A|nr:hypothetical protein [Pseudomonas syringae]